MRILVVNAGSSSVKLRVIGAGDHLLASRDIVSDGGRLKPQEVGGLVAEAGGIDAVGHRIVHGGGVFHESVRLDANTAKMLRGFADLAPTHQAAALDAAEIVGNLLPAAPAVACFDTAFHGTLPVGAYLYAVPRDLAELFGLRRFGFHGLSHAYASRRAARLLRRPVEDLRIVTCHLGSGASLAAVAGGRSVDTTMGFTPLEGLVMARRAGSVDPGLVLWLLRRADISPDDLADRLEKESGLVGLCGRSDMREVLSAARTGVAEAQRALEVYVHRLRASIASMAAAMDGLDALVFTGGIGENAAEIRQMAAAGLRFLGVELDRESNERGEGDREIGQGRAAVRTLVVTSREDLEIAAEVRRVLAL